MATDSTVTNKDLMALRFARSTPTYNRAAIVQRDMANDLVVSLEKLAPGRRLGHVLELGCGTGLLTEHLLTRLAIDQLTLNDIIPSVKVVAARLASANQATRIAVCQGDMESIELPRNQDLVVSNAVLQWSDDPKGMLRRMLSAVRPGGLLALTTFGIDNLPELRRLTGSSLRYLTRDAVEQQLVPDAEILESRLDTRTITFDSAVAVLQHLKQTGVNSLQQESWTRRNVQEFCSMYESSFSVNGRVPLTYHPLKVIARRSVPPRVIS